MKIVIIGGGSVGFYLAKALLEHGHKLSVIETDPAACTRIADELDLPVSTATAPRWRLSGTRNVRGQRPHRRHRPGRSKPHRLPAGQAGVQVPRTVAKVNNPKNAGVMSRLGVDITVSSIDYISRMLEREVDSAAIRHVISLDQGKSSISEVLLPQGCPFSGKPLSDVRLPEQSVIVTVERDGETIIPRGNTKIYAGDKLLIVAKNEALHAVKEKLRLTD